MLKYNSIVKTIFVFSIIFFMITGDLAAKMLSISPLTIKTDNGKYRFSTIFDLTNKTNQSQALAALIVLKNNRVKWWRGVKLPILKSKSKQKYFLQFNSRLILAMDFDNIYVLIYDEDYQVFFDSSSKHGFIKSDVIYDRDVKLKLYDKTRATKPKIFLIGEKNEVINALKSSQKSNAVILSDVEIARISGRGEIFVQTPVTDNVIVQKQKSSISEEFKQEPEVRTPKKIDQKRKNRYLEALEQESKVESVDKIEAPEFIEEEEGVKINVDGVFAQYFTYQTNPRLTYQAANPVAEPDYIKVSVINPERLNIAEQEKIVSLYVNRGQNEKAIVFLSDQLTMAPEEVDTYINLSNVYLAAGDKTSALEVLNSSLTNISFSKRMAVSQELTERSRRVASQMDVKEAEFLAKQFSVIGQSFLDEGKYFEALRAFESLQTFKPDFPGLDAKINLCRERIREIELQNMVVNLEKEKAAAAESKVEELTVSAEDVPQIEVPAETPIAAISLTTRRGTADQTSEPDPDKMIDFYIANREIDKAEFFLKEQVKTDPENLKAVLRLVGLYQQQAKYREANDLMSNTLTKLPENQRNSIVAELQSAEQIQLELSDTTLLAKEYETQGVVYFNDKDCARAHPLFQNLLTIVPGYPGIEPRIAACEEALGYNQELALKETTKAVMTADVIRASGQILLTGIPRFSNIYLFKQGNLVQQEQVELSQFRAELEPGEYSLFIQSYGYEDYQSNITISAQTLLNENVSLTAVNQTPTEQSEIIKTKVEPVEEQLMTATKMHSYGW